MSGAAALAAAQKIARLPRQAVEATKRVLNLHVERAVLATIDFAMAAEAQYTIGLMYEGQTMFSKAAETFEKFADKRFRDFAKAPQALLNAGLLREAIEDYDAALRIREARKPIEFLFTYLAHPIRVQYAVDGEGVAVTIQDKPGPNIEEWNRAHPGH